MSGPRADRRSAPSLSGCPAHTGHQNQAVPVAECRPLVVALRHDVDFPHPREGLTIMASKRLDIQAGAVDAAAEGSINAAKSLVQIAGESAVGALSAAQVTAVSNPFDLAAAELMLELRAAVAAAEALIQERTGIVTTSSTSGFEALSAMDEANRARLEQL